MPNIFKSMIIRRFLAHTLEILTTFALTLILIQILIFINNVVLNNGDIVAIVNQNTPDLGAINQQNQFSGQSLNTIYQLIISFTIFYFIFTTFNFFFTFSFLYPKNDFRANFFQRLFGFKKFDFGKKKLSHFKKAVKMLLREIVLFLSVYGFFTILVLLQFKDFFELINFLTQAPSNLQNIFFSLLSLFIIFVLPSTLLSMFTIYKTKGKQLFWDYLLGITLK